MLKQFSLAFIISIATYAMVLVAGLVTFIMPAAANGLAGDPVFSVSLVLFLAPLVVLLYYLYYSRNSELKSHTNIFMGVFVALTAVDALFLILFVLPIA